MDRKGEGMLNLTQIEVAADRIRPSIYESPLVHSKTLSRLTGNSIFLKLENLQMTGSFKERGALNRILTMTESERRQGVIAASAGNHGQGVAYHAAHRGIPAQIWMPRSTPLIKLTATRGYGADIVLHGDNYDETCAAAVERSIQRNATFIHPFDDDDVIAEWALVETVTLAQRWNIGIGQAFDPFARVFQVTDDARGIGAMLGIMVVIVAQLEEGGVDLLDILHLVVELR